VARQKDKPKSSGHGEGPPPEIKAVVGLGASAGGMEALSQFLEALPVNTGMAFVIVQHLSPGKNSALRDLLAPRTRLPIVAAQENMTVDANRVHIIPPGVTMSVLEGRLHLFTRLEGSGSRSPIDFFFRSLAEDFQERAIGVVLSGTASDGASGLREIKAMGGITIAQDPTTARFDGMPLAAIATGQVDLVLSPQDIARELARISDLAHPAAPFPPSGETLQIDESQFQKIFELLKRTSGADFRHYKQPTLKRRIHRRMTIHKVHTIDDYIDYLQKNPKEVHLLYQDILIHVTRFFREPESFEALNEHVFPQLLESWTGESPIRIWVVGCSTGEEVYSVAIAMLEHLGDRAGQIPVQIFGTDISESAVDQARAGTYPDAIAKDVSEDRLKKFFSHVDGQYRISKVVRDMCIFARQDVTQDPPFSRLDLIVCRNVLIYLGPVLQKKLMGIFHYALIPGRFLVLGAAETTGLHGDYFALENKKHRIYTKRPVEPPQVHFSTAQSTRTQLPRRLPAERSGITVLTEANQIMLDKFAPPGVIVDSDLQIIQFRGYTGAYLEPSPGEASLGLLKMVREGLLHGVTSALNEVKSTHAPAVRRGLTVKNNGSVRVVDVEVLPLIAGGHTRHYLILFQEVSGAEAPRNQTTDAPENTDSDTNERVHHLQQELAASRDYLQSIIQDLEAANEELQSANEEILSSNEELQSTNEELDTAKEEMQSTNEELNTLNEELFGRNEELGRVNSDLMNLLGSVDVAITIVDSELKIRKFTLPAERLLNLLPSDIGRPLGHIKPNVHIPEFEQLIRETIDNIATVDRQVLDTDGRWYSLRIRPYKDLENRIDGAVVTLSDISAAKQHERELNELRNLTRAMMEAMKCSLIVVDADLNVADVNRVFTSGFGVSREQSLNKSLFEVLPALAPDSDLAKKLKAVASGKTAIQDVSATLDGTTYSVNARHVGGPGAGDNVLITIDEHS
jgi:two-component system, chemotaxis family, CheB/CheR fusion protein